MGSPLFKVSIEIESNSCKIGPSDLSIIFFRRRDIEAPVVHPVESQAIIFKKSFLYFLSVLIHWLSYNVKVTRDLVIVSAVLNDVESIYKALLRLFRHKRMDWL